MSTYIHTIVCLDIKFLLFIYQSVYVIAYLKGLCIDMILGKTVDMSSVNIGNIYIVDIWEQTHFPYWSQPAFYQQRLVNTLYKQCTIENVNLSVNYIILL